MTSDLTRLNAAARAGATVDKIHGVDVADPYRTLERSSTVTDRWIEAQTERTERYLQTKTDPQAARRLDELLSIGVVSDARVGGTRVFYRKREGDREQPWLVMRDSNTGESSVVVDPLDYGARAALDWHYPSPDGHLVAFGISQNGDERSVLRVLDVDRGKLLPDAIPRTKWTSLAWLHSQQGFYYTRYPAPEEPDYDSEHEDTYFPRIFFHRLGSEPDQDPRVFGSDEGTDFPQVRVSENDRWLIVNVFRGWSQSDVFLLDRGERQANRAVAPTADRPLVPVDVGGDHLVFGEVREDLLYLTTNQGAPRYRIDRTPAPRAGQPEARQTLIAQSEGTIDGWDFVGDHLALHYIEDVHSRLRLFDSQGAFKRELHLPTPGSVESLATVRDGTELFVVFSSYLSPPTLLRYSSAEANGTPVDRVSAELDLDPYEIVRERVRSPDGTEIPVTLLMRKSTPRDGQTPVLLYGYGGFNVSILPSFVRNAVYWLERGGAYAVANIRGGGEFGEQWHRAGSLQNKEHCFEDFEAVVRWLSDSGLSQPSRIAITGGSNGGLLVGALVTRAPETFRAAASYVGLYDMVRFHHFPPAELWISEYGSADSEEQFPWLLSYSPYHQIREGTRYPAVLVETADHDSRVHWAHSTKFVARLQDATSSNFPVLFYMERQVGHGAGTRRSDLVERYVRQFTFLEAELGIRK